MILSNREQSVTKKAPTITIIIINECVLLSTIHEKQITGGGITNRAMFEKR